MNDRPHRLTIGIDAKWYFTGHVSGRVWTQNVVEQLVTAHPQHRYVLFLKAADRSRAFSLRGDHVELRYVGGRTNLTANALGLPRACRGAGLDVLITQNFAAPAVRARQLTVIHDIIFETDPVFFTLKERCYFAFIKPMLRSADGVIVVSDHVREELYRYRYLRPGQDCHVQHNGVADAMLDVADATPGQMASLRARLGLPERFVLYLGRLNQRKNVDGLLRAMARIDDSDLKLVLAGATDRKMFDVGALIGELGLERRVVRLGHVEARDVPELYRAATAFAFVSHREGFGIPPLEAMACGVPAVVSRIPSLVEVCGDAVEYVDPDRPEDIARGIRQVTTDLELRRRLIASGRDRAERMTWAHTARRLLDIVQTVAS